MNKKDLMTIIVIFFIVGLVLLGCLKIQNRYKKPIENYFAGIEKANINTYSEAFPEFMGVDKTMSEESLKQDLKELENEYGKNIKIKYKVKSKEKIDKDSLEILEKVVKSRYNKKVKVRNGYTLEVETTLKGDKGSNTDTTKMYVYKIDGKWKYIPFSSESLKKYVESLKDE